MVSAILSRRRAFWWRKFTSRNVLLLLIFLFIILLRFWKVADLFNFTFSEEHQAHLAWEQVKNFHPIWIGVSAANINYYLGPGVTYLNALLFFLSKGDPVILAYFSAILGLATTISLYYLVKELFSKEAALFTTIIYGGSTLINFHDRRFWNPTPIPFVTVWFIFSLIKAQKDTRWFILTAILVGTAFHTHLTLLLFLVPAAFTAVRNIKKIKLSTWLAIVGCYLIITSPLIVFDLVHNFDNILMPYRVLTGKQRPALETFTRQNTISHIKELLSATGRIWFIKFNTNPQDQIVLESHADKAPGNIALSLLSFLALGSFLLKNRRKGYESFFISFFVILTAFILYPSYNPEYYLMSFLTLLTVAIGFWLNEIPKPLAFVVVVFFLIVNLVTVLTMSTKYGLMAKKKLIRATMNTIKNQSFTLQTDGALVEKDFTYAGWRYLFKAYGKTPTQSNIDKVLGWIYPDELSQKKSKLKVIVADTVELNLSEKPLAVYQVGVYRAYVFRN
ncbi:glycosyltransferase family 39 protein [Candidatus Roizmanbacteria bacterium]|nr:glycosyltransferase family 39 protein [Candidatus Roizmanbacteria bacterium]